MWLLSVISSQFRCYKNRPFLPARFVTFNKLFVIFEKTRLDGKDYTLEMA